MHNDTERVESAERPVLVAVDLSEASAHVLKMASDVAASKNRPMVVAHVVSGPGSDAGRYRNNGGSTLVPMIDVARRKLEQLVTTQIERHPELNSLRDARIVLVEGLPAGRIVELAELERADMIIMGTKSRSRVSRMLSGSVSQAVTRASAVPVTVFEIP